MAKNSRQLWKEFVEGRPAVKQGLGAGNQRVSLSKFSGMILGIDPSLRGTGLAVIEFISGGKTKLHHSETVRVPQSKSSTECLAMISARCEWVSQNFTIDHVAVEQTIYVQNYRTAMILGMAKGAALGVLARGEYEVFEYPPLRVKQAIVGQGRASKDQVAQMVTQMLGHADWGSADESDAAGVALCHGFTHKVAI